MIIVFLFSDWIGYWNYYARSISYVKKYFCFWSDQLFNESQQWCRSLSHILWIFSQLFVSVIAILIKLFILFHFFQVILILITDSGAFVFAVEASNSNSDSGPNSPPVVTNSQISPSGGHNTPIQEVWKIFQWWF